ncbi:hypothetical protein M2390_000954 [Mycetocola sp. BIGb0189]|uniref:hypothetical protein n=1 Tax=Mycetocola sp. BIGb0189 TaxID=2940604 RepID=UPI00216A1AA6|nr:hypothetical protein [Mycetocola sp. BIGb0189]MCS4275782.1 hypothetical protein [Mycetocola sp. BIGb0189]
MSHPYSPAEPPAQPVNPASAQLAFGSGPGEPTRPPAKPGRRSLIIILASAGLALILAAVGGVWGGQALGVAGAQRADAARVERVVAEFDGKRESQLYSVNRSDDEVGEAVLRRALRQTGVSGDIIDYYYERGALVSAELTLDAGQLNEAECRTLAGTVLYLMAVRDHPVGAVELVSYDGRIRCSSRTPLDVTSIP